MFLVNLVLIVQWMYTLFNMYGVLLCISLCYIQPFWRWGNRLPYSYAFVFLHCPVTWYLSSAHCWFIVLGLRRVQIFVTGPPNSNRIWLTERFASPYGALCFHMFTDSDSPLGTSCPSLKVVSLLVSNQTSFMQKKRRSKIITCGVLMHKNESLTYCYLPTLSSRIKQGKESCYSHLRNQR